MSEQSIVVRDEFLTPKYISEDDIPRDGGRWPEYCNTMIISIDSFENRLASGCLCNFYFEDATPFSSLDQLLISMESVMEKAQMPQSYVELSQAVPIQKKRKRAKMALEKDVDDAPLSKQPPFYSIETLRAAKGELANFYIRVYSRQHASMQGVLVDAKNNDTYAFRSGVDLIRVLYELLSEEP